MSKRYSFKILGRIFFIFFYLSLFVFTIASPSSGEDRSVEMKGPVTITASTLNADNKAHTALFEGSVIAKTETMTISSDKMLVYYAEGGKITKIDVDGHVKLVKGERVITSDTATYFADEDKVIFAGQPKAVEGNSMVTGTKMIYLVKEDRSIV
jgi:lipopolysaccharide export system protein LptA